MSRRSRAVDGAGNFWPGYVDAMSNVVMNLLFLVAMFAISAGILGATKGGTVSFEVPSEVSVVQPNGKQAAPSVSQATQANEAIAAGSVPAVAAANLPQKVSSESLPLATGAVPRIAQPDLLLSSAAVASPLPSVFLQVTDAKRALGGPLARVVRRSNDQGGLLLQVDLHSGSEPILELEREGIRQLLRSALPVSSTQRLRIWSNVATPDAQARRQAFAALAALRNALADMGWKPQQIETRLIDGAHEDEQAGQRLYILMLPVDQTPVPAGVQLG